MATHNTSAKVTPVLSVKASGRDPAHRAHVVVGVGVGALAHRAKNARAGADANAAVAVDDVGLLPGSQRVFLTFRLDRASVPYIAERG